MAENRKSKDLRQAPGPENEDRIELPRDAELCDDRDIKDTLAKVFEDIINALDAHADRYDNAADNWDMYNCQFGNKQFYNGTSNIYVPIVRDALEARKTRFTNQLFPRSGRYADCISQDATRPSALMALLDFYVRKAKLHTSVVPALVKAGDIEGQYSLYVSWVSNKRHVAWKTTRDGMTPDETIEEVHEATIEHAYPHAEVISDADLLILPTAASGIEDALAQGGCVVVIRRWTKTKIKQLIEDGEIDAEQGKTLLDAMQQDQNTAQNRPRDPAKQHLDIAGIKKDGRGTYALVYEVWCNLLLSSQEEEAPKEKRLCRAYMAGQERVLSCRRNPFWSDKIPVLSVPKDKVADVAKGRPICDAVRDFQYAANDAVNMGMDSAAYALMPIVMTDPEKNPAYGSMILTMAAIWKTSPNDTQFVNFPALWKDALEIVDKARQQIFQTLGVNPSQITQGAGVKKKLNQAEIALEQQVDLLTTADAVSVLEEGILTPLLERFIELDHQFRDEDITVPAFGDMGVEARMEKIPPIQFDRRYHFMWYGVEAARNAQQTQQQIAGINVLRGIPPQMYQGYRLNIVPAITYFVESTFGPRLAPLIFEDIRKQISQDPHKENEWLSQGIDVAVRLMDNHMQHIQVHQQLLQEGGEGADRSGAIRVHIFKHQMAMQDMMNQQQQQGQPGAPGGAGKGLPGQSGPPRIGAQPGQPRGGQNPPGAIHADQMHGPGIMPRRAG